MNYEIKILWYYDIAGHGRGTVDAMSSFGCKSILRDAIVVENKWFEDANEMVSFLQEKKKNDVSKKYHLIDHKITSLERIYERSEYVINGCMSYHMISVDRDGVFDYKKILHVNDVIEEEVQNEVGSEENDNDNELIVTIYDVIQPGTYVGLRSPSSSIELFFVVKVMGKGIASEPFMDKAGHIISRNEKYSEVIYLDVKSHHSAYVKFDLSKKG